MRVIWYILLILFAGSCDNRFVTPHDGDAGGCSVVLNIANPQTRSLNGTASEVWEKKINNASIYVFNSSGKTVYVRTLTAAEITAINNASNMTVTFLVPGNITKCDIYMVANTTPSAPIATKVSLLTSIEQDIGLYNGTYATVTTSAKRTNGFVMTGSLDNVNLSLTGPTTQSITLRRIVAKLAIEMNISALLTLGSSVVTSVTISQTASVSNLFPLSSGNTTGQTSFTQTAQVNATNSRQFFAFFYIYENDESDLINKKVKLAFLVVNTVLGIGTTYTYNAYLTGDGDGKMKRNRGYYVIANVNKLINLLFLRSDNGVVNVTIEEKIIDE